MNGATKLRDELSARCIAQQKRFDALAAEHSKSGDEQIALRRQMLADLITIDRNLRALVDDEHPITADDEQRLKAENLELLARFNATTEKYAEHRAKERARLLPIRDALAGFYATRSRLAALGFAAPDLIRNEDVAAMFEPFAFEAIGPGSSGGD